ncbi:MAG: hypothetical protein NZ789_07325, partial [Pseudomonadales bacterium]|nr:hypothetical protein [Pseudomonadales bacterium]
MKRIIIMLACVGLIPLTPANAADYDIVLSGGRVIDPETGLDASRNVGIKGDKVASISEDPLTGTEVIDVSSLVVAPGFIDIHSHSPTPLGQKYQALDGVTTALELEAGAFPVLLYGAMINGQSRLNFGASAGYGNMRGEVMQGIRQAHIFDPPQTLGLLGWWTELKSKFDHVRTANTDIADADERTELEALIHEGIDQGGMGIGLPLDYY